MTDDAASFDPDSLPRVETADPNLPGRLELGVFSLSLNVADLSVSRDFYERLGFVVFGGDAEQGWLILRNGETTLGLFQGVFERNILTFHPGLTPRVERLERFTDVRTVQQELERAGVSLDSRADPDSTGAASIMLTDPDGNPILFDQFF